MYRLYLYTGWIFLHKRSVSLIDMDYISDRFVYSIELNTGYICTKDNIYTGCIYRYISIDTSICPQGKFGLKLRQENN